MIFDKRIEQCELAYFKCFSTRVDINGISRFKDDLLKDMYAHNFTYIHQEADDDTLKAIINEEILLRLLIGEKFCNVFMNFVASDSLINSFKYKPYVSHNGFYLLDVEQLWKFKEVEGCVVKKVINQAMIDDVLTCDLQYEAEDGRDFCIRRCHRRSKVYLSDDGVDCYVCYYNDEVIGRCDLFIHDGIAKIEDFSVLQPFQRKGYGTTMLKNLITIALNKKAHTIYLVADEEGTAKEMYEKLGFSKIGENSELFFNLTES